MWIGLAVLLATLAGAVLLYSTADSPKPKFITKIIAVAVHVRRAKGAISPDSATDLFEGRYAWWAGDEIAWRETVRRAELQAIDDIPSEDDKLCVIAFQDSKPNWEEVESPTALRGYLKDAQEGSSLTKLGYYKVEGSKMLFDAGFQR